MSSGLRADSQHTLWHLLDGSFGFVFAVGFGVSNALRRVNVISVGLRDVVAVRCPVGEAL